MWKKGLCLVVVMLFVSTAVGVAINKMGASTDITVENNPTTAFSNIAIEIIKPKSGYLYIYDKEVFPLIFMTVIIGSVTVEANVESDNEIDKVEFYIDNELNYVDYEAYYSWEWVESAHLRHEIKVIAYDIEGNTAYDSISVYIFNKGTLPKEITKDDAMEILMGRIIKPASSDDRLSAFMLSKPLQKGDVITVESGENYEINKTTWFVFIDDDPQAFFAHSTRFVLIDAKTASYNIINEVWPPTINNLSMWDMDNLIEIYCVLNSSLPLSENYTVAPYGDYGDAPDGQLAYYGIDGEFPTLYNTKNSKFNRTGAHALHTGYEIIGSTVSVERGANDMNDVDGIPNLVDSDKDDRLFIILENKNAKIAFSVSVSENAPDITRYVNVLIDLDQNGKWEKGSNGKEWVIINEEINVSPGTSKTIIIPFSWGNVLTSPVWMRIALTRERINETLFGEDGWDGSGEFEYGEIEDHLVFLMGNPPLPHFAGWWPPWPNNPPGGQPPGPNPPAPQPPGGDDCPCGITKNYYQIRINCGDKKKHIAQGKQIVKSSVDRMKKLCDDDPRYVDASSVEPLKSGQTKKDFINAIQKLLNKLKDKVKCCDEIIIYICGHGHEKSKNYPNGGIQLYNNNGGKITENGKGAVITKNDLMGMIKSTIPPCTEEGGPLGNCDEEGTCCHIKIIIESCHAGNFKGACSQGMTVIGTSDDSPSHANCRGGVYTNGFIDARRDKNADKNGDGKVDADEADEAAKDDVEKFNKKCGKNQKPWKESQECDCKCPCEPSVDGDKWVWDEESGEWVDEIYAYLGQPIWFACQIVNDGECRNVTDILMIDWLPYGLQYGDEAILYINGQEMGPREPDDIVEGPDSLKLTWNLDEIGEISPEEYVTIIFSAIVEYPGEFTNLLYVSAHCTCDPSIVVSDEDVATVNAIE